MYSKRASIRLWGITKYCTSSSSISPSRSFSSSPPSAPSTPEIQGAREYCSNLIRKYDSVSHTLLTFIPPPSQTAYLALQALNVSLAMIPDNVSTAQIGTFRFQFWHDAINANTPPKHPIAILLSQSPELSKHWLHRIITTRKARLTNPPFPTLGHLETYAENTYSTLLYLILQSLPYPPSITTDHLASHIGKATGIVATLRGVPLLAFPPPPNHHSNPSGALGASGVQDSLGGRKSQGVVNLPLDVMADAGLREEDVLRHGAEAPGLREAVFRVATRASDHLITARTMLANLRTGQDVGHAFEHEGEEGHEYEGSTTQKGEGPSKQAQQVLEVERAFGVLMPAVATGLWLERLQKLDFDVFDKSLRRQDWKLPWRAWRANRRKTF